MDIPHPKLQNIEGFVEVIIRDTIYGWVTVDPARFSLSVLLDGIIIGFAEEFLPRTDLSSKPYARGFCIKCDKSVTPADLVDGRLQIIASSSHSIASLPVWRPLQQAGTFMNIDLAELKKALNSVPTSYIKDFIHQLGYSQTGRAFKRISSDGLAQVGRNGYLFLVSGSNHLSKFYTGEVALDIEKWVACFARRRDILESMKVRYIQIVIPEKSSIYYDYAPYGATAGSKPFLDLIQRSLEIQIPICDVLPGLLAAKVHTPVYPQGDTHLNTFGAEIVINSLLEFMQKEISYTLPGITQILRVGDLSIRFSEDGDIQELVPIYETLHFGTDRCKIELISSFDPETGHHGRRRVWRNDAAPIKKRVICFGNSFFERGENSGYLSWWSARLFSEFHFIWSPDIDISYVEMVSPDIVICQSIERFLTEVPAI